METIKEIKGINRVEVSSMKEAFELGYKYIICWRNHYRGNSKGEIMKVVEDKEVFISHVDYEDRGIEAIYATNEDIPTIIAKRKRIINLITSLEFGMTCYSSLYSGGIRTYQGSKMVFGIWRSIYKIVKKDGCTNFDSKTFGSRHSKLVSCLKNELEKTSGVSSTMAIL